MYTVNTQTQIANSNTNFIDTGIHENVEMTNIEYKISPNGNKMIVFSFAAPTGETLTHTEWEPKDNDPEKEKAKQLNQIQRIKQIAVSVIPENEFVIEAKDFEEFCRKTQFIIGNRYVGKKLRIKVVYNNGGYTSLPNYGYFIEPMSVPQEKSKLKIISIDRMTRETPDKEPTGEANPFATVEKVKNNQPTASYANIGTDNLPF